MNNTFRVLLCALLLLTLAVTGNAQSHNLPRAFRSFLALPELRHATVSFEMVRLPKSQAEDLAGMDTATQADVSLPQQVATPAIARCRIVHSYDPERLMTPASVLKTVTCATALRLLGADYVWPDSLQLVDTAAVALPGLECYNPDWLIEDIDTDYMPPLSNALPDSGRVLLDVMAETLKESLNLQAETFLRLLSPSARLDSALLVVRDYWEGRGLDVSSLVMYDGCGLSPSDRVTAHFITSLLADMQFDDAFRRSLAVAGRDGTVSHFLAKTRLAGRAQLKTGSLKNVIAYAGYVHASDGHDYALCLLTANASCRNAALRKQIEKLFLAIIP